MPRPSLILAASVEEIWPFVQSCPARRRLPREWRRGWVVSGSSWQAIVLLGGMGGEGPVRLAERAVTFWQPRLLLMAGFGGALTPVPQPTEVMVATACYALHLPEGRLQEQPCPAPPQPVADLVGVLRQCGLPAHGGTAVTTVAVTPKPMVLPWVRHLVNPVVDLESARLAVVAQASNVPFLVMRAITDGAQEEIQAFLAAIINQYHGVPLRRLLPALLARPRRLRHILHLWQRSRRASRNLATALQGLLPLLSG